MAIPSCLGHIDSHETNLNEELATCFLGREGQEDTDTAPPSLATIVLSALQNGTHLHQLRATTSIPGCTASVHLKIAKFPKGNPTP